VAATGDRVDKALTDLAAAARALKRDTGLNLLPTLARLAPQGTGSRDRFLL